MEAIFVFYSAPASKLIKIRNAGLVNCKLSIYWKKMEIKIFFDIRKLITQTDSWLQKKHTNKIYNLYQLKNILLCLCVCDGKENLPHVQSRKILCSKSKVIPSTPGTQNFKLLIINRVIFFMLCLSGTRSIDR